MVNAPAWIDAPSEDVPLTVTLPGVWSATLIFGSIVVPAEKERSLLVEPDAPSTLMVRSQCHLSVQQTMCQRSRQPDEEDENPREAYVAEHQTRPCEDSAPVIGIASTSQGDVPQDDRDQGRKHRHDKTAESKNKAGDCKVLRGKLRRELTRTVKTGWGAISHGRISCSAERTSLRSRCVRYLRRSESDTKR